MADKDEILKAISELDFKMKNRMSELKSEMIDGMSELKSEMISGMSELKSEMTTNLVELKSQMTEDFKRVNKRLDGIENELRKIDTILGYRGQYDNIPS